MKRGFKNRFKRPAIILLIIAVVGVGLWRPWHRASMDQSIVPVPPTPGTTAPAGREDVAVIFYSGDGGWRDLDQQLGAILAAHGMPVVGISLLEYYWRERPASASAADLNTLITRTLTQYGKQRIWLIGFSFGADVLPSIVDQLNPAMRARIAQIVLLSPTKDVNFEIEMEGYISAREGWLKTHTKDFFQWINPVKHYDAMPPLRALNGHPPVVCYYGSQEKTDTVCAEPGLPAWVKVYEKPGDHHFNYDYAGLARQMITDLPAAGTP